MEQLKDFFREKKIKTILDVGTGAGDFIKVLKKVFTEAQITGIDPNIESLEKAKGIYPEYIFQTMGAENLKFADDTFDLASVSMALHHLPEVKKSFSELQRVVKPGGWIILNELFRDNLNPAQEVHKMFHHFRGSVDRILGISHHETFKKDEILQMVSNSGIDIHLHFEFCEEVNLIASSADLEERVEKMKQMLEQIKHYPEFEALKPQIKEFRKRALLHGFQPATKVVIVGKIS